MANSLDQAFVLLKQWILGWPIWPDELKPLLSAVMVVASLLLVFATLFAITTVFERKGLARIQNRYGPNRVGVPFTNISLFGFGQPIADGIKALIKEDFVPLAADKVVHFLAPLAMLVPISLTFAVLPVGRNMVATDMDAGLLFFFAVGALPFSRPISTRVCLRWRPFSGSTTPRQVCCFIWADSYASTPSC